MTEASAKPALPYSAARRPTTVVRGSYVTVYDTTGVPGPVYANRNHDEALGCARALATRSGGLIVDESAPSEPDIAASVTARRLGPRRPGGVYRGVFGAYVVLLVQLDLPDGRWVVAERDLDGEFRGRVREHSTAWDRRTASVVAAPAGRPVLSGVMLTGVRSGVVHAAWPVAGGDVQLLCDAGVRPERGVVGSGLPVSCRRCVATARRAWVTLPN